MERLATLRTGDTESRHRVVERDGGDDVSTRDAPRFVDSQTEHGLGEMLQDLEEGYSVERAVAEGQVVHCPEHTRERPVSRGGAAAVATRHTRHLGQTFSDQARSAADVKKGASVARNQLDREAEPTLLPGTKRLLPTKRQIVQVMGTDAHRVLWDLPFGAAQYSREDADRTI